MFLGVWLVLSASAWAHEDWAYSNKWLVGLAAAVVALLAFAWPKLRFVNTVLGVWLVISTLFIIPCTVCETKALWHDSVVGALIALASLTTKRLPGAPV